MVRTEGTTVKPKDPLLVRYEQIKLAAAQRASATTTQPTKPSEPYYIDPILKSLGNDNGSFGGE